MWKNMSNIRFKGISLEKLRRYVEKQKARKYLIEKWVINVEDFKELFEKSFTEWITQIVWTSRKDLEKYLGLAQSDVEEWADLFKW